MRLGVLGGLGPMATAYYLELVIRMTDVKCDQDHPEIILLNIPTIPDRTAFILGKSHESPLEPMIQLGLQMKGLGVTVLATPCVTAHYFHEALQEGIGLPVIHVIKATAELLKKAGIRRVGLMATDGTVQSGIFQQQIEALGMELILPDAQGQRGVMALIYDQVKAGLQPDMSLFATIRDRLRQQGAEVVVLGCTELSLLKKEQPLGDGILDVLDVLAKESVLACGKPVKPEFDQLFIPFLGKE
ncbi:MAG: aspartate/glutamate racemase family protein [Ruminococcaceae bacterium]|nr:aspartate/glutamate racemase family protein [Oscillospiraceae bacterium]MBQ3216111.1 aspartate/glutamate racemase family protein [Oscillospiraceae bacterium]